MSLENVVSGAYYDTDWWPRILTHAVNPVTRTVVKLNPPLEFAEHVLYSAFCTWFLEECRGLWFGDPRQDPKEMDASNWRSHGERAGV